MAKQTRQAVTEADVVVFVVDARDGLSAQDHEIANYLRRLSKPCLLAANKAEGMQAGAQLSEFYELGWGGRSIRSPPPMAKGCVIWSIWPWPLCNCPMKRICPAGRGRGGPDQTGPGRLPNAGKSTSSTPGWAKSVWLLLTCRARRAMRSACPLSAMEKFELIDTAGLRRKGKVFQAIEKFSVVKTLQAIESANVVLLLIDATEGVTDQDAHIAGYILESGRAVVLAVNKWDALDEYQRELVQRSIETRLGFLKFANLHFISAIKRQVWHRCGPPLRRRTRQRPAKCPPRCSPACCWSRCNSKPRKKLAPTAQNALRPPRGMNPPIIVIHGNSLNLVTDAYKRFLEGALSQGIQFGGDTLAR